jgi:MFS family permease
VTLRGRLGALEERQFRLLFLGQAATAFGNRMSWVALPFGVLAISDSAAALGLVLACGTLSMAACLLVGGVLADRLPRRDVMVWSDLLRFVSQAGVAVLLVTGSAEVWHLALVQTVNGAAGAFFIPAQQGLVPETVSPARLQQANALLSMSRDFSGVVGPALAGILVATVGAGWAIGLDALTFLASAAFLARVDVPAAARRATTFAADLRGGWREFTSRTWVWASVAFFGLFQFVVLSAWFVLGPYVSERELGGAGAWAAILVASAVGSLAGAAIALRRKPSRVGVVMFALCALFGPQLLLLAAGADVAAIAAAAAVASVGMGMFNALWFTALQERIPEHARSRVSSYDWFGSIVFLPLGMALVGPLADAVGATAVLLAAGGFAIVGSLLMTLVPAIRGLRRDDTPPAAAAVPAA